MKKRHGFTLVELIVVLAIIGVLAALLVPAMLGYVRRSKISSANDAAKSIQKAINSACIDIMESGENLPDGSYTHLSGTVKLLPGYVTKDDIFGRKIYSYMESDKNAEWEAQIEDYTCVAVAACIDGAYVGTSPAGVVTEDNYETKYSREKLKNALEAAVATVNN